ncbi:hypothetical protein [Vibrio sp. 10N.261.51.F12]|uniref:hypothetical protein n=1 Tax=Vibrio sp. 10N.261.51.F12 TaxID=3229679 RepID=UPI0035515DB2
MTMTELFNFLNAPLHNSRWSWGAVNPFNKDIVLRVWADERREIGGNKHCYFISGKLRWTDEEGNEQVWDSNDEPDRLGQKERDLQVGGFDGSQRIILVVCHAEDVNASPRAIKEFNQKTILVAKEVVEYEGGLYAKATERLPVMTYRQAATMSPEECAS